MAYWLFQGNPKYYRVLDGIRDFEQMPQLVTRYAKDVAPGDGVLVWVSGKEAGIYALAEVTEPAQVLNQLLTGNTGQMPTALQIKLKL